MPEIPEIELEPIIIKFPPIEELEDITELAEREYERLTGELSEKEKRIEIGPIHATPYHFRLFPEVWFSSVLDPIKKRIRDLYSELLPDLFVPSTLIDNVINEVQEIALSLLSPSGRERLAFLRDAYIRCRLHYSAETCTALAPEYIGFLHPEIEKASLIVLERKRKAAIKQAAEIKTKAEAAAKAKAAAAAAAQTLAVAKAKAEAEAKAKAEAEAKRKAAEEAKLKAEAEAKAAEEARIKAEAEAKAAEEARLKAEAEAKAKAEAETKAKAEAKAAIEVEVKRKAEAKAKEAAEAKAKAEAEAKAKLEAKAKAEAEAKAAEEARIKAEAEAKAYFKAQIKSEEEFLRASLARSFLVPEVEAAVVPVPPPTVPPEVKPVPFVPLPPPKKEIEILPPEPPKIEREILPPKPPKIEREVLLPEPKELKEPDIERLIGELQEVGIITVEEDKRGISIEDLERKILKEHEKWAELKEHIWEELGVSTPEDKRAWEEYRSLQEHRRREKAKGKELTREWLEKMVAQEARLAKKHEPLFLRISKLKEMKLIELIIESERREKRRLLEEAKQAQQARLRRIQLEKNRQQERIRTLIERRKITPKEAIEVVTDIVLRLVKKEPSAMDEFESKYKRLIYKYIHNTHKIHGVPLPPDKAEEIYHDVFLSLIENDFRKLRLFQGKNKASLPSWIRTLTTNFCLDLLKKKKPIFIELPPE